MLCNTAFRECTSGASVRVVRVVVIDQDRGRLVVTQKGGKSHYDLGISGWVEAGEDLCAAASREMVEELGVSCMSFDELFCYRVAERDLCIGALLARVDATTPLHLGDELAVARWAPFKEGLAMLSLPEHLVLVDAALRVLDQRRHHGFRGTLTRGCSVQAGPCCITAT